MKLKSIQSIWQPAVSNSPYLLMILHGQGETMNDFLILPEKLEMPNMNYLLLNAPEKYGNGCTWFDSFERNKQRSFQLLETVLAETEAAGFKREKIFLFGFAQGSHLALEFGARSPRSYAGFIGVSGGVLDAQTLLQEASPEARRGNWLIMQGSESTSAARTREQIEILLAGGLPVHYVELLKGHNIDYETEVSIIRHWITRRM